MKFEASSRLVAALTLFRTGGAIMQDTENLKKIYNFAYTYLEQRSQDLNLKTPLTKYFFPLYDIFDSSKNPTLDLVFERILVSLQNRSYMPNVINFDQDKAKILSALELTSPYNFQKFATNNIENLLAKLKNSKEFTDKNQFKKSWKTWLQGAVDGAKWLSEFNNLEEFKSSLGGQHSFNPDIPQKISKKITGFGFALACDFLKELGFINYGKPDVHLINMFKGLNLIDNNTSEQEVLCIIKEMADSVNVPAYQVDKIFWLIATENFYLDFSQPPSLRDKFIKSYSTKE